MTLRELLERRAALAAELRSINEKPAGEAGELSAVQLPDSQPPASGL